MISKHVATTKTTKSSTRARFARRFLRSLVKIRKTDRICRTSKEEIGNTSRTIKMAAYSSMARAVGPRKAWSRALVFKLRNRAIVQGASRKRGYCLEQMKKKKRRRRRRVIKKGTSSRESTSRADKLRKLVPGGDAMDICCLLEETAHYIKCLATQVKVMQSIADHYTR